MKYLLFFLFQFFQLHADRRSVYFCVSLQLSGFLNKYNFHITTVHLKATFIGIAILLYLIDDYFTTTDIKYDVQFILFSLKFNIPFSYP